MNSQQDFLALLPMKWEIFLRGFCSQIRKYCIFIARDRYCFIVLFTIPEDAVLYVYNFLMVCGWPIYFKVFCKMMSSLPVTKHPLVYASDAEAATNFLNIAI